MFDWKMFWMSPPDLDGAFHCTCCGARVVSPTTPLMRCISRIQSIVREHGAVVDVATTQKRVPVSSSWIGWFSGRPQVVLLGSEKPASLRMLNEIPSRELPRLVLMLMTPDAAAVPYSVDPAAPFTTSTDSMSRP